MERDNEAGAQLKAAIEHLEQDLTVAERKYRTIFDQSLACIEIYDASGKLIDANPACLEMFGVEDVNAIRGFDLFADPNLPRDARTLLEQGEAVKYDMVFDFELVRQQALYPTTKSGQCCLSCLITPLRATDHSITGYLVHVQDITDRKRAEVALREAESRLRAVLSSAPITIFATDNQGIFTLSEGKGLERVGLKPGENVGVAVADLYESLPFVEQTGTVITGKDVVRRALAGETVIATSELRGGRFDNHVSPLRDADGKVIGIVGVAIDITERMRAIEALQEREAFIGNILDSVDEGFIVVDREYRILSANRAFCRLAKSSEEQVVGHPCYEVSHHFTRPCFESGEACVVKRAFETGTAGFVSHTHEDASGAKQYVELRSYPVTDASGTVVSVIETVNDVTEERRLEEQLRQAIKMEAVGRLAGGVAHDFNNMLGVIIGHAELALDLVAPTHPLFDNLQEIRRAAGRSADLTRQLLAFARKQIATPKVLDLNETVEGMLKMLRRLVGENIDLAWLPGAVLWPIKVDPSQIDQILANLCVNARDAIAGVGKITVETHAVTLDDADCAYHPGVLPGAHVVLVVSDDGCGMDRETLDNLFEPFFTTKQMGKGTGLGLATVYGIVKQNNGFINVYSEPGHGTTFKIYLPRHAAETEQIRTEHQPPPAARGHETILLVEDDRAMMDMARLLLSSLGYRVLAASTPGEAIRVAKEHAGEIDLLITDVVMPEMNGRSLAKNLLALYPGIKPLFMSGYTADVIAHHGVLDEGVDFVHKPFSIQALAAKVREALDGK